MKRKCLALAVVFFLIISAHCYAAESPTKTNSIEVSVLNEYYTSLVNYYYSKLIAEKYVSLLKTAYPSPKQTDQRADVTNDPRNDPMFQKAKFKYEIAWVQSQSVHAILSFIFAQKHNINEKNLKEFEKTSRDSMIAYKEFCEAAQLALQNKYGNDSYDTQKYFMSGNFSIGEVTKLNIYDFTATFLTETFIKELFNSVKNNIVTPDVAATQVSSMITGIIDLKNKKVTAFKTWFDQLQLRSWDSIPQ